VRIHLGKAELVPELVRYFDEQTDCIALQVGETEVEVSLLGSYREERHDAAVDRLVAAFWAQANGGHSRPEPYSTNGNGKPQPGAFPA
jgi:hypothetical protein